MICTQRSFGRIVRDADPPIGEEAREGPPALEHVVHRLGDLGMARELGAFPTHPDLELGHERGTLDLPCGQPLFGAEAVDGALDLEQRVDALDGLSAMGEIAAGFSPLALRRALAAMSASTKNWRRLWAQQAASRIGPELRPAR
jgi:hypothetical protein